MSFYPAHDLALAAGVRHYTPPASVRRMQQDLASLAAWWEGPWGWNYDTRAELLRAGTPPEALPSDADLIELRRLSSRERTAELLPALADLCPAVCPPRRLADAEALGALLAEAARGRRPIVLKAPWSSSGRGQMRYRPCADADADRRQLDALRRHGEAVIRRMGCVMAEPWYDGKRHDFAMLFHVEREDVRWEGYSLFETDAHGTYRAGILAPDARIEDLLCAGAPAMRSLLAAVRARYLDSLLPRLFGPLTRRPWDVGYVGIDMMTLSLPRLAPHADGAPSGPTPDVLCLHPCVEMNVRCTMGVVARHLYDAGATGGREGRLRIVSGADGHFSAELDVTG